MQIHDLVDGEKPQNQTNVKWEPFASPDFHSVTCGAPFVRPQKIRQDGVAGDFRHVAKFVGCVF